MCLSTFPFVHVDVARIWISQVCMFFQELHPSLEKFASPSNYSSVHQPDGTQPAIRNHTASCKGLHRSRTLTDRPYPSLQSRIDAFLAGSWPLFGRVSKFIICRYAFDKARRLTIQTSFLAKEADFVFRIASHQTDYDRFLFSTLESIYTA